MKNILLVLVLSIAALNLKANEPLLDSAKSNYDKSQFSVAISQYEEVLKKGLTSSNLHYNLGNAYFRNGQLGLSILNFEKAIKLDPSNENAVFNLELANTKLADKFEAIPQFSFSTILISINNVISHNLTSILSCLLILGGAAFFVLGKKDKNKKFVKYARLTSIVGILFVLLGWKIKSAVDNYKAGILVQPSSNVFSEPNPNSTLLFEIHEGVKLEILSESNGWINVKAPNNEVGWIQSDNLGEI